MAQNVLLPGGMWLVAVVRADFPRLLFSDGYPKVAFWDGILMICHNEGLLATEAQGIFEEK